MISEFQDDNEEIIVKTVGSKNFVLQEMQELRIDVDLSQEYEIELMKGTAEIFGTEIALQHSYRFCGQRIAIFTWKGAEIRCSYLLPKPIIAKPHSSTSSAQDPQEEEFEIDAYIGDNTPMPEYLRIHEQLRKIRHQKKLILKGYTGQQPRLDSATALSRPNLTFTPEIIEKTQGPRVLLVGDFDTGKSTIGKILTNYACRNSDPVIYVDLDPDLQEVSVPGTIAAVKVGIASAKAGPDGTGEGGIEPLHPVHEFNVYSPLVHFFGRYSPSENPALYKDKIGHLIETVEKKLAADYTVRTGGVIVKTNGWCAENNNQAAFDTLLYIIQSFQISHVFVLDNNKLTKDLKKAIKKINENKKKQLQQTIKTENSDTPSESIKKENEISVKKETPSQNLPIKPVNAEVSDLKKSSGCIKRNKKSRDDLQRLRFRTYLKGKQIPTFNQNNARIQISNQNAMNLDNNPTNPDAEEKQKVIFNLNPHSVVASFKETEICEINNADKVSEGMLPIGEDLQEVKEYDIGIVDISDEIETKTCILAVSFADKFEDVLKSNIMGFVYVQKVDMEKKQLSLLCPIAGKLTKKYLLRGSNGSMKWIET